MTATREELQKLAQEVKDLSAGMNLGPDVPGDAEVEEARQRHEADEAFYKTQADLGVLIRDDIRPFSHADRGTLLRHISQLTADLKAKDAEIERLRVPVDTDKVAEYLCERYARSQTPWHERDHTGKRMWRQDALDITSAFPSLGQQPSVPAEWQKLADDAAAEFMATATIPSKEFLEATKDWDAPDPKSLKEWLAQDPSTGVQKFAAQQEARELARRLKMDAHTWHINKNVLQLCDYVLSVTEQQPKVTEGRITRSVHFWRNDALRNAASIVRRYSANNPNAEDMATDIEALLTTAAGER